MSRLTKRWKDYLSVRKNITEFIVTVILSIIILYFLPKFLLFIEGRNGFVFEDPLLSLFPPVNLTWFTFSLIYLSLLTALIHLTQNPPALITALRAYVFLVIFRMTAMYLLPLNPPEKMILLNDPFVQLFGAGDILTKDLFFSGHTSTMFLFALAANKKYLKIIFLFATFLVGLFVILQHVHYSIDVFAAPFFTYAAFRLSLYSGKFFKL